MTSYKINLFLWIFSSHINLAIGFFFTFARFLFDRWKCLADIIIVFILNNKYLPTWVDQRPESNVYTA